jgi:NADPH:quinone reductase-like Zn-dependent oxidoreductase
MSGSLMMKAAVLDKFGPSSVMQIRDLPMPEIGADQVLLEVFAGSVNPIDWKIREGMMAARYGEEFPMVLGFDASGIVADVGDNVTGFKKGDEVFARSDIGAGKCYAEYAAINVSTLAPKPGSISHEEAAAMPLAALTALNGLRGVGQLAAGQRALIIGASGGVGIYAVQIAKCIGAHVTAVCSGRNADLAIELGADQVIDYTQQNPLATDVPYDVIYDTVASQQYAEAREVLTENGVYMTLVPSDGIDFFFPGQTERQPRGGYFLVWAPTAADLIIISDWVQAGKLRSVIDSTYALDEIGEAHERSQTLRARGKIVIKLKEPLI